MMVPAVWLINILFSLIWLHFFAQGPLEWLWRRFTLLSAGKSRITDNAR